VSLSAQISVSLSPNMVFARIRGDLSAEESTRSL